MPPLNAARSSIATLHKRIKSLAVSSAEIRRGVTANFTDASLDIRIEEQIKLGEKIAAARENLQLKDEYEALDIEGTKLWNLSTNLARFDDNDDDDGASRARRALNIRLLAYFLLDCSQPSLGRKLQNTVRLFKVAIKAGKSCLDHKEFHWAGKLMEKAAKYHHNLLQMSEESSPVEDKLLYSKLSCDYFILRTTLAWKQSNLSMADYMYGKATENQGSLLDPRISESLADVLYDIGNELLAQNVFDAAVKWLQRSFDVLSKVDPVCLSESGGELRLSVTHGLTRAYIGKAGEGDFDKARNIINIMIEDWPTRLTVHLLRLDLTLAENSENVSEYHAILLRMISIAQLTETTFKTIIGKVHVLASKRSARLACNSLDELLSKRLLYLERDDWIEQAFITRLWLSVQDPSLHEEAVLANLQRLMDSMAKQFSRKLGSKATHAAQILLWKVSEAFYAQGKYQFASAWCKISLHHIFDKSGELNHAKISRRIILCAIKDKDYGTAAEIYNNMPQAARDIPFTRFLMFKVAMRTSDDDLAESCLQSFCDNPDSDRRLLYACALDAQDVGNRKLALKALGLVLQKIDAVAPDISHMPAILRCTIRLTMAEIEGSNESSASVESLCILYEKAAEQAKRSSSKNRQKKIIFTTEELGWFSRTGYNLGLRSIVEWPPPTSLRIISTCIRFLELYPEDIDATTSAEISYRRILCFFLCASLNIELARLEDNIETQLQHYLIARRHIQEFRGRIDALTERSGEEMKDLKKKHGSLLSYEFECAVNLKDWDSLGGIVEEAAPFSNVNHVLETMADIILCSSAPNRIALVSLQSILNHIFPKQNTDISNLARWIRCMVQLSLVKDTKVTEHLLVQVLDLARNSGDPRKYPNEEMEWLAATIWNRCIDFHCASDVVNAKRFSELALSLAGLIDDDRRMVKFLQTKLLEINWS